MRGHLSRSSALSHLKGGAIQLLALIFLLLQNAAGPLLYGGENYGATFFFLSFVFILQGALESVFFAVTIERLGEDRHERPPPLGTMWRDGAVLAILVLIGTGVVLTLRGDGRYMVWLVPIASAQFVTTALMGLAYGTQRLRLVFSANLMALVAFTTAMLVMRKVDSSFGLMGAFLAHQIAAAFRLLCDAPLRRLGRANLAPATRDARTYLVAFFTRAPVLVLGNGLIVAAGILFDYRVVAIAKIYLSLMNAGRFVLPLSGPVLQSIATRERGGDGDSTRIVLAFAACFWVVLAGLLFFAAPRIAAALLDTPSQTGFGLIWLFIGMPAYLLMQPLALAAFAAGAHRRIILSFLVAISFGIVILVPFGLVAGFVTSVFLYVAVMVLAPR